MYLYMISEICCRKYMAFLLTIIFKNGNNAYLFATTSGVLKSKQAKIEPSEGNAFYLLVPQDCYLCHPVVCTNICAYFANYRFLHINATKIENNRGVWLL